MVARVALVAAEIDGPVDEDRELRIYLDQAVGVALVPVVAGPRLIRDVLDREGFVGRQLYVFECATPAFLDCRFEHAGQFLDRDDELFAKGIDASRQVAVARHKCIYLPEDPIEMRGVVCRRDRHEERRRLLVERGEVTCIDAQSHLHRVEARDQVPQAIGSHAVGCGEPGAEFRLEASRLVPDRVGRQLLAGGFVPEFFRTIVGVDVVRIDFSHRELENHVLPCQVVNAHHRGRRRNVAGWRRFVLAAGGED